jgi:2-amino-4-hydroxy-6-hydroxymethyldihydropteridine diphosphokinase
MSARACGVFYQRAAWIIIAAMHKTYLGLGSNLGDRVAYLEAALTAIAPSVTVLRRSPIYETAPWGYTEQDAFLNMVIEAETLLAPGDLLATLKGAEAAVGRQPRFRNGPREIDMDILLYDDLTVNESGLSIPHPRLHERAFMLIPLADVDGDLRIPGQDKTVSELLRTMETEGVSRYQ